MQKYLSILKRCQTLASACKVYVAVMLDETLTAKQKDEFQVAYLEYVQGLKK